jgi:hypothetical protein
MAKLNKFKLNYHEINMAKLNYANPIIAKLS